MKKNVFSLIPLLFSLLHAPVFAQDWVELNTDAANAPKINTDASYCTTSNGDIVVLYLDGEPQKEEKVRAKRFDGKKWTDMGDGFSKGKVYDLSVLEFNNKIYAAYRETTGDNSFVQVYDGNKWSIAGESANAGSNHLITDGKNLYWAYYKGEDKYRIMIMRLVGNQWIEAGASAPLEKDTQYPFDLAFNKNNELHIAYFADKDKAKVKKLTGEKWVDAGPVIMNRAWKTIKLAFDGNTPYVAAYKDFEYKVYLHNLTSKKENGREILVWSPAGSKDGVVTEQYGDYLNLAMINGVAFVGYREERSEKMKVVKPAGEAWTNAGPSDYITEDTDAGASMKLITGTNKIYVVFRDPNKNNIAIKELSSTGK